MQTVRPVLQSLTAAALVWTLHAAPAPAPTAVTLKNGRVVDATVAGAPPFTNSVALNSEITVLTNGTFTVSGGAQRSLSEGQILSGEGRLMSPGGKLELVYDHVTIDLGQVTLVKDGKRSPVTAPLTLPTGAKITPEGWVTSADGKRSRLLDGQMVRLSGSVVASRDTITLTGGVVIVQKDGARLRVAGSSSMMMSDGTKVFGTGRVLYRDGREEKLSEGQIIVVEGAR